MRHARLLVEAQLFSVMPDPHFQEKAQEYLIEAEMIEREISNLIESQKKNTLLSPKEWDAQEW
jgi:hypothetical protein